MNLNGLSQETILIISDFIKSDKLTFSEVFSLLSTPKRLRIEKFDEQIKKRVPRFYQIQYRDKIQKVRNELENYD